MKNTFKSAFIAALVLGAISSASAQTDEGMDQFDGQLDLEAIRVMKARFENDYQEKHQKVLEMAKIYNWPLKIDRPDGGVDVLMEVSDRNLPIYIGTSNYGSSLTSRVSKIQPNGGANLNLDGTGMIAGMWEINAPLRTHLDFGGRVTSKDGAADNSGIEGAKVGEHPTHVSGTIMGSGANTDPQLDPSHLKARGMAYNAKLYCYDIEKDLIEMSEAVGRGVLVSNHSYGLSLDKLDPKDYSRILGTYVGASRDFDEMVYNAKYYQPCVAAGNDRNGANTYNPGKGGHDLLSKWSVAKNSLIVAAVGEVPNYVQASDVQMSSFSSWGPTDDNRIKPDISNKGVQVYSTIDGAGNKSYGYLDGTSMATPGVTGALVLLQQHYKNLHATNPGLTKYMKSATVRGLVAHTADEAGTTAGPDSKFGWGLINAERAAKVISDNSSEVIGSIIMERTLQSGDTYSVDVFATGEEPLIATLSWSDLPGVANEMAVDSKTPVLVNDLDIRIKKGETEYFPWKLGTGLEDAAIKGDNIVDNIEKVEIDQADVTPGYYNITISHKGSLPANGQECSLIVSGINHKIVLGVDKNEFSEFSVWPNPANDLLNVSLRSDLTEDANVVLYDVLGKKVLEQKLNGSMDVRSGNLNVGSLNPGIYLVKVSQGNKQSVRKVVIK